MSWRSISSNRVEWKDDGERFGDGDSEETAGVADNLQKEQHND